MEGEYLMGLSISKNVELTASFRSPGLISAESYPTALRGTGYGHLKSRSCYRDPDLHSYPNSRRTSMMRRISSSPPSSSLFIPLPFLSPLASSTHHHLSMSFPTGPSSSPPSWDFLVSSLFSSLSTKPKRISLRMMRSGGSTSLIRDGTENLEMVARA